MIPMTMANIVLVRSSVSTAGDDDVGGLDSEDIKSPRRKDVVNTNHCPPRKQTVPLLLEQ